MKKCMNCGAEGSYDALCVTYKRQIVGIVCDACLDTVKKPQVTLTRATPAGEFEPQQYIALEVFR